MTKFWKIAGNLIGLAALALLVMLVVFLGNLLWSGIHWAVSL